MVSQPHKHKCGGKNRSIQKEPASAKKARRQSFKQQQRQETKHRTGTLVWRRAPENRSEVQCQRTNSIIFCRPRPQNKSGGADGMPSEKTWKDNSPVDRPDRPEEPSEFSIVKSLTLGFWGRKPGPGTGTGSGESKSLQYRVTAAPTPVHDDDKLPDRVASSVMHVRYFSSFYKVC